jgi:hypothetical protein
LYLQEEDLRVQTGSAQESLGIDFEMIEEIRKLSKLDFGSEIRFKKLLQGGKN